MSSLRPRSFSDLFNFSRSTVGTYCGADGVLASAAVNVARIGYDPVTLACRGLLIEPARTNYLLRSQEFDNASWTKTRAAVTANADIAPDGTTTADKLVEDSTANDSHYLSQSYTKTSTTEVQAYSASVWVKAAGRTQIRLQVQGTSGAANSAHATFDLSAGTVGAVTINGQFDNGQARIEAWPRGWYRCILDFRVNNDGQAAVTLLALLVSSGTVTYNGDGTSGVYVWGAQLEKGFYGSSYIPTTTAAAARERDVCTLKTLSPWFQESEGTLFAEYLLDWTYTSGDVSSPRVVQIDDGTEVDRHILYLASGSRAFTVTSASVAQATITRGSHAPAVVQRQAMAWDTDDVSAVASGSAVSTDTTAVIPTGLTTFRLGASSGSTAFLGYIRKVRFYPRNMTDAELLALVA